MQDLLCPAIVCIIIRVAVRMVDGFNGAGDDIHVQKDGFQAVHTVSVHRHHIGCVHIVAASRFNRENCQHFHPIRHFTGDGHIIVCIGSLQRFQLCVEIIVDLGNGRRNGYGVRGAALVGKEDAKG